MYRYYQVSEKSKWHICHDCEDVEKKVSNQGAKRLTILALSEPVDDEETNVSKIRYKGPFYADIDIKEDIPRAAAATLELVNTLVELDVPIDVIEVRASGGKGFHVCVPAEAFSSGRAFLRLPSIYLIMARQLYVEGMDLGVYKGKKGVCWRLTNTERSDGMYPVEVEIDELRSMTTEQYRSLVSAPREVKPRPKVKEKAHGLSQLFDAAKREARHRQSTETGAVADEDLAQFSEEFPACIQALTEGAKLDGVTFHDVTLQVGIFVARAGVPESLRDRLFNQLKSAHKSDKYDTEYKRKMHLEAHAKFADSRTGYKFSCRAMRTVIDKHICSGCPMLTRSVNGTDVSLENFGIIANENRYHYEGTGKEPGKPITSFILHAHTVFKEYEEDKKELVRSAIQADIKVDGEITHYDVFIPEKAWHSKSSFINTLNGRARAVFTGNDSDVQKIKYLVMDKEDEMETVIEVHSAGIHTYREGDYEGKVYVEPNFSYNDKKVQGTHFLSSKATGVPRLKRMPLARSDSVEVSEALHHLVSINMPHVTGIVLGWFCAAHLKTHMMKTQQQFPLLNLWGGSGTGKTSTAKVFHLLTGCDPDKDGDTIITSGGHTAWTIKESLSSTTTVPRIFEEFNQSLIGSAVYKNLLDAFKASFNNLGFARGKIGKNNRGSKGVNAETETFNISAPILFLSEQTPRMTAIRQRTVQVQLEPDGRDYGREHFMELRETKKELLKLAKTLVTESIKATDAQVDQWVKMYAEPTHNISEERPRLSFQIVLAGLEFLTSILQELGWNDRVKEIEFLKQEVIRYLEAESVEISRDKGRSEVDLVLTDIALMAHLEEMNMGNTYIIEGTHYAVDGDTLYLDLLTVFRLYRRFKRTDGEPAVIVDSKDFLSLIKHEPYFKSDSVRTEKLDIGRAVVALDLVKMKFKGIDIKIIPGVEEY